MHQVGPQEDKLAPWQQRLVDRIVHKRPADTPLKDDVRRKLRTKGATRVKREILDLII